MLHVEHLGKAYGRTRVLRNVAFDVQPGTVVALLGANGAGKTTTLKCILGVMPFDGTIEVDGIPVRSRGKAARGRIGYVPQLPALSETDTCKQALTFMAELKGAHKDRVPAVLDIVNLSEQRDVTAGHLSGGMRQRLALAAALLADPPLLLLDEPTASLDLESRREFDQLIARLRDDGRTIILSTHLVDRLHGLADRVLILNQGDLTFDGTLDELAERTHSREYIVHLNGNTPDFMDALRTAGFSSDVVRPADLPWEELLLAPKRDAEPEEGRA
jgi:ABC-type multidrug transport system ATPase subunit